jgi:hypothetical protein
MWRLLVVVNVADFKCHGCIGVIEGEASSGRLPQVTFGWLPISKTSVSSCDSGMCKPRIVPGFAVERSGLYVFVLRRDMVGYHGKSLAIPHRDAARKGFRSRRSDFPGTPDKTQGHSGHTTKWSLRHHRHRKSQADHLHTKRPAVAGYASVPSMARRRSHRDRVCGSSARCPVSTVQRDPWRPETGQGNETSRSHTALQRAGPAEAKIHLAIMPSRSSHPSDGYTRFGKAGS